MSSHSMRGSGKSPCAGLYGLAGHAPLVGHQQDAFHAGRRQSLQQAPQDTDLVLSADGRGL
jgi:hypothetical protein